jgi:hypothetical protein
MLLVVPSALLACFAIGASSHAQTSRGSQGLSPWVTAAHRHGLEVESLYSIAIQESRRSRGDGTTRPWPWTLHTPIEGAMYFESFEAAREKLQALLASGVRNIDIGLMQVNWAWHGHRVARAEELLEPAVNIDVAASILRENLDLTRGDLRGALARYHSVRADLGAAYAASVLTILEHLKGAPEISVALNN